MSEKLAQSDRMLSESYERRLQQEYPTHIVSPLVYNWRQAPLLDQPGEHLPYVRLNQNNGTKPVLYVPGFTEGIVAKAAFGAELANLGHDVVLPDQNHKKILEDAVTGKKSATYSQAVNYLAALKAEKLGGVDIITHSYGSLIFDAMTRIAAQKGLEHFQDSKVIMLAPAGFSKESFFGLIRRLLVSMRSEGRGNPKEFDEPDMLKAGIKNAFVNVPRALREGVELSRLQVDYEGLLRDRRIGSLCLVSYAADALYPEKVLEGEVSRAVKTGASWCVPIGQKVRFDPKTSKPHATHNDEQYNPYRVAGVAHQLLQEAA